MGIELFERAAEARGRFLRAEQLQAAGGASDPQRGPGFLLTFDVGRILVAADPGNQSLLLRQVKNPEEVASIRLTELGEEEPWWRIVGDPLTAVWPVHRGAGASGGMGAPRELRLQFRESAESPRVVVLGFDAGAVRVFEQKSSAGAVDSG